MADDDTTRIVSRKSSVGAGGIATSVVGKTPGMGSADHDDSHTRLYRPKRTTLNSSDVLSGASAGDDFTADPVVGWLVIVEGPGRGQSVTLGYGMNGIGRGGGDRVTLAFGDEEISRHSHAMLTYDGKGRKFYIQHGDGANLTYVGDTPVLQPRELTGREVIGIGKTKLCFVPLCGPDFEW